MKTLRLIAAAAAVTVAICAPTFAAAEDINPSHYRYVTDEQDTGNANPSYVGGRFQDKEYRSIMVFDIPVGTQVTAATLRLHAGEVVLGPNIMQFKHISSPESLYETGTDLTFFNDLGDGLLYGAVELIDQIVANGDFVEITLNSDAIAEINANQGGRFAIGIINSTIDGVVDDDFGFGYTEANNVDVSELKLKLTRYVAPPIPTMTEWAMIGLALALGGGASMVVMRRRRLI